MRQIGTTGKAKKEVMRHSNAAETAIVNTLQHGIRNVDSIAVNETCSVQKTVDCWCHNISDPEAAHEYIVPSTSRRSFVKQALGHIIFLFNKLR
jgi:hypothetical protein